VRYSSLYSSDSGEKQNYLEGEYSPFLFRKKKSLVASTGMSLQSWGSIYPLPRRQKKLGDGLGEKEGVAFLKKGSHSEVQGELAFPRLGEALGIVRKESFPVKEKGVWSGETNFRGKIAGAV